MTNNANNINSGNSGTVVCTPKRNSTLNKAEGQMAACKGGVVTAVAGIFFDGTGNNMFNVASTEDRGDSYNNGLSNVARAYEFYESTYNGEEVGKELSFYIDGIGTTRDQDDNDIGFGTGFGITGIKERAKLASRQLIDTVLIKSEETINMVELTIDVFGFSRGAATARHFISLNSNPHTPRSSTNPITGQSYSETFENYMYFLLNTSGNRQEIKLKINWRFAGLYETVSSYGIINLEDDVKQLGLMDLDKVKGIFHIVAADEYREKFSITPILTPHRKDKITAFRRSEPGKNGYRQTIVIPGVHSDIGGGYNPVEEENNLILYQSREFFSNSSQEPESKALLDKMEKIKKRFIDDGWYKEQTNGSNDKIFIDIRNTGGNHWRYVLLASRKTIWNTYSYIPLHFMTQKAKLCGVPFDDESIYRTYDFSKYSILKRSYNTLKSNELKIEISKDELKKLRSIYLHWSSRFNTQKVLGISISPHSPRFNPKNNEEYQRLVINKL
ncbi:DUF2235 domain-containing protein [uncultured Aquimarina sp.]|uniref:T6SS phospholipase effector Tle1-like catalytic domain-containing protein n=1 Tax=uncultured Aquimarina sp. TaxID=575652 RepID=UPI002613EDFB|nr:DUF2235 domain-containing protein [uncultured Aquimarina sp.]